MYLLPYYRATQALMMYGAIYFICDKYFFFIVQLRLSVFCQRFIFCDMYLQPYYRATRALMMYGAIYFICDKYFCFTVQLRLNVFCQRF